MKFRPLLKKCNKAPKHMNTKILTLETTMQRHFFRSFMILVLPCLLVLSAAAGTDNGAMLGFNEQGAVQQRTLEAQFDRY